MLEAKSAALPSVLQLGSGGCTHYSKHGGNGPILPRCTVIVGVLEQVGKGDLPVCLLRGTPGTHWVVLLRDQPLSSLSVTSSFSLCFFVCLSLLPYLSGKGSPVR